MADRKISVLHVGALPVGGSSGGGRLMCRTWLTGLAARGYRVRTLSPITEGDDSLDCFAARHEGITVHPYTMAGTTHDLTSAEQLITQRRCIAGALTRLLAEQRSDVVLVGHSAYVLGVPEIARTHGLPCIVCAHSALVSSVAGVQRYPETLLPELLRHVGQADLVIAVAKHVATSFAEHGFDNVVAIPNAVDTERFAPMSPDAALRSGLGLRGDDVVVMHLSNLNPAKRAGDIIQSATQALKHNAKLRYVMVGHGRHSSAVIGASEASGIADRVRFTGWVDPAAVPNYLSIADVVAMPSATEGLALAYLETQACGKTLLASDIPAAREVVSDGETGVLFPAGDVDMLTERTLALADDPKLRRRIGRQARAWVAQHHDLDDMMDIYAAHVEQVVRDHKARGRLNMD